MTAPNMMQRDAIARSNSPNGLVLPLPSPLLAMMPPELQGLPMEYFIQVCEMLAVAPLAQATDTWTVDKNHAFVAFVGNLKARSSDNQTNRDDDPAAFSMTDTQNLQYQQPGQFIDVETVWGSGKQPAIWPVPLVAKPNSGITITVLNQDTANTNNYRFSFIGVLVTVPPDLVF
jgi:hypothetical protein